MGVYDFDLESYIGLARRLGTDTKRVEVKAAAQGLPKSMAETLSAFSNTSGGVVVSGVGGARGFPRLFRALRRALWPTRLPRCAARRWNRRAGVSGDR